MKKALALILTALLAVMLFPVTAFAATLCYAGYKYDTNTELITGYYEKLPSAVTIPISLPHTAIKGIGEGAFRFAPMESVVVPDYILKIEDNAFAYCYKLKSFTMPGGTNISKGMFFECKSLKTVRLNDDVTWIDRDAFKNCTSLENITIPELVPVLFNNTFEGCTALKSIDLPENLKYIYNRAFSGCTGLTEITLPENMEKIDSEAFGGCSGLQKVMILSRKVSITANAFAGTPAVFYGLAGSDWQKTVEANGNAFHLICEVQLDLQNGQPVVKNYPEAGSAIAKPADPKKTGYTFGGWYTDKNCSADNAWDFSSPFTADTTLYAKWTPLSYPVNFVGSAQNGPSKADFGTKLEKPKDPVCDGFVFEGWYKDTKFKHKWDFNRDVVKGETTLYAKLTPFESFKPALAAASADYKSIRLTWRDVQGAAGYEVWRSDYAKGKYKKVAMTTGTELTDGSLTTGKTYFYKIRAYRKDSDKTVYSALSSPDRIQPVPAAVTVLKAENVSAGSVKLTWDAVKGGTVYEVWRKTGKNGRYSLIGKTTLTGFTNKDIKKGGSYTYRVRACCVHGGKRVNGKYACITIKM